MSLWTKIFGRKPKKTNKPDKKTSAEDAIRRLKKEKRPKS